MIYKKHRIVILAHFASPGKTFWLCKVRVRCWLKCCLSGCDMSFPSFWGPNVQESTCFGDLISKKRPFGCRHIPWLISKNTTMMVFCSAVLSTFCWLDWQVSLTNLHNLANRIININEDNDGWCKNSHKHYGLKYVSINVFPPHTITVMVATGCNVEEKQKQEQNCSRRQPKWGRCHLIIVIVIKPHYHEETSITIITDKDGLASHQLWIVKRYSRVINSVRSR